MFAFGLFWEQMKREIDSNVSHNMIGTLANSVIFVVFLMPLILRHTSQVRPFCVHFAQKQTVVFDTNPMILLGVKLRFVVATSKKLLLEEHVLYVPCVPCKTTLGNVGLKERPNHLWTTLSVHHCC